MPIGTIKRFDAQRGFGLISNDEDPNMRWQFVHISQVAGRMAPEIGDVFTYELGVDRDGRKMAVDLRPLEEFLEADRVFGSR